MNIQALISASVILVTCALFATELLTENRMFWALGMMCFIVSSLRWLKLEKNLAKSVHG